MDRLKRLQCILLCLLALATIPFLSLFFIPMLRDDLPFITRVRSEDDYAWNINDTLKSMPSASETHLKELRLAAGALQLTEWLKRDGRGGWCNSLLAREDQCRPVSCLKSPLTREPIDLTTSPLTLMAGPCPIEPIGGQLPHSPDQPVMVSFILTLHNNDVLAAQAVLEIFRTAQEVPGSIQFCVFDDGSDNEPLVTVATLTALRRLFGIFVTYQRNEISVGFGEANNKAAQWAQGQYVALINTDMFATPGWMSALLFTFSTFPNAGMVGPLYIGEGNLITEAGGIVFRDANAANYGRSFTLHHEFLYARNVDYISAACVMIPKRAWQMVGGFDLRYERGYYEDTDMAMAFRKQGMEVYFQPGAIVYHQEGHTFGADSPLKIRLMAENKEKFIEKWRDQLERGHGPVTGDFQGSSTQRYTEKLYWVAERALISEKEAGSRRARRIASKMLSKGIHLTLQPLGYRRERTKDHRKEILEARLLGIDVLESEPSDARNEGKGGLSSLTVNGVCGYQRVMISGLDLFARTNGTIAESCPSVPIILDLASSDSSPFIPPQFSSIQEAAADKRSKPEFGRSKPVSNRKIGKISPKSAENIADWIKSKIDSKDNRYKYRQQLSLLHQASTVMVASDLEMQVIRLLLPHLGEKPQAETQIHFIA